MKRAFDLLTASALLIIAWPLMLAIATAIKLDSRGPILHLSRRIGRHNAVFRMPKFRTMRVDTPELATHLLPNPNHWITRVGRWLRKTSLDELPQLWSVVLGDMSLVGPRPALFNQHDLVQLRSARCVHELTPGLTGWAQVNGRDNLSIPEKVVLDEFYLRNRSMRMDARILLLTFIKAIRGDDVANTGPNSMDTAERTAA